MSRSPNTDSLEAKQNYLHKEIIQQEYDPQEFQEFMANQKGLDLDQYSMKQLKGIVKQFKGSILVTEDDAREQQLQNNRLKQELIKSQENQQDQQKAIQQKQQSQQNNNQTTNSSQKISNLQNITISVQRIPQKKQNPKKGLINLKQMKIPQYKPPSKDLTKVNDLNNNESNSSDKIGKPINNIFAQPSRQSKQVTQQKSLKEILASTKFQNNNHKDRKDILNNNNIKVENKKISIVRQDQQDDDQQQHDRGFIGNGETIKNNKFENKQILKQNSYQQSNHKYLEDQQPSEYPKQYNYQQSMRQSSYVNSSNNKFPVILARKQSTSSLFKQIKSEKNFLNYFQIKVRSFSKKQSNSLFKFSYITYHVETSSGVEAKYLIQKAEQSENMSQSKRWKVQRRFNDFKWLYQYLVKTYTSLPVPPIPDKTKLRSFDDQHLEQRMILFQRFLSRCIRIEQLSSDPILEAFLSIQSRQQLEAVKKKFQNKLKNRDQNLIQFLTGEEILYYKQPHSFVPENTKAFYIRSKQLLTALNEQLRQLERNLKMASEKSVSASNIFRQLSQLHQMNPDIKGSPIFDVMSEYIGQLSYKLDNQAYHLKNYASGIWMYEQRYTQNLMEKINQLDKQKTVLETKFRDYHSLSPQELSSPQALTQANPNLNPKYISVYKKTKQLYDINLALVMQQISRHENQDLGIISKEFLSGISKYVDLIKDQMITGVDLITKSMTVAEGKSLKEVELISDKKNKKPITHRSAIWEE